MVSIIFGLFCGRLQLYSFPHFLTSSFPPGISSGFQPTVDTSQIEGGLINNPDMVVEVIGQVADATNITVSVANVST